MSLGRRMYSLDKKPVRERQMKTVLARFDPDQKEWVFLTENEEELVRRPPKGLDVKTLTGLDPLPIQPD